MYLIIFVYVHMLICLCIREVKGSNDTGMGGRNCDYFIIVRHSNYPGSGIVFFDSGLSLVANIYCKL